MYVRTCVKCYINYINNTLIIHPIGNCLSVIPGRQYDRVYCGAACPESHEAFIKQFVRIGGILVMPYKDQLLRVQRMDEDIWTQYTMLPVSFATLVIPPASEHNLFHLRT